MALDPLGILYVLDRCRSPMRCIGGLDRRAWRERKGNDIGGGCCRLQAAARVHRRRLGYPIPVENAGVFGLFNIPSSLRPSSMTEILSRRICTVSGALEMLESSTCKASYRSSQ